RTLRSAAYCPHTEGVGGMSRSRRWTIIGWLGILSGLAAPGFLGDLAAQDGVVSGSVIDAQTLRPLASAQVMVEGSSIGALTDQSGRFQLTGLSGGQVEIRVQLIGYQSATQTTTVGTTDLSFALRESAIALDAIVVTGTPG